MKVGDRVAIIDAEHEFYQQDGLVESVAGNGRFYVFLNVINKHALFESTQLQSQMVSSTNINFLWAIRANQVVLPPPSTKCPNFEGGGKTTKIWKSEWISTDISFVG